ncbi:sugar transferase [Vibrio sp. CAIM 722]|uniref:Sugar transferase n=1 Tax=Vibrio eleionomae TaxID=2653505 RepID=A0A7X4RWE2_9VIBR|nr:sugar transferase [Vibrio eleionomae]MZI95811.1 sugar transferase [Vibrio eleionomae]
MLRFLDIVLSLLGLIVLSPVFLIVYIVGHFDTGAPLFFQERVGKNQKPFILIKFRTMPLHTKSVATHLVGSGSVTKIGHILRRTKLDELPQLINVIKGEMSLVGPRPCLFNQENVIYERAQRGAFDVRPGITGLAQIREVDMSTPVKLAELDREMIRTMSVTNYFLYIIRTVLGEGAGDRV